MIPKYLRNWRPPQSFAFILHAFALIVALATFVPDAQARNVPNRDHYTLNRDSAGWTIVEPDSYHRKIYVSNTGSDNNDGLSPQSPKQTIAAAVQLMRDDSSDWLLLNRGDTFSNDSFGRLGDGSMLGTGDDPAHPQVLGAYGSGPRPVVQVDFIVWHGPIHNLVVRDIVFGENGGIDFLNHASSNILFENVLFDNPGSGRIQAPVNRVTLYRCTFLDSHQEQPNDGASTWGDAHGNREMALYIMDTNNFLLEQCIMDHNGWEDGYDPDDPNGGSASDPQPPSMYSHNVYFGPDNLNLTVRENISTRGASMGIKMVSPGLVEGNVFVGNNIAVGINDGDQEDDESTDSGGDILTMRDNVVMHPSGKDAHDIGARGWGLTLGEPDTADGGVIVRNIEAHSTAPGWWSTLSHPWKSGSLDNVAVFEDNVVYNYSQAPDLDPDPNTPYPDPSRDIISYNMSVGGQASLDDFYQKIRALNRANWNPDYLARNIVDYMQEGFGIAPGGTTPVDVTGVSASPSAVSVQESDTTQLTATVSPSNATDQSVSWSSNNTSIATVDQNGLVTGVSVGTAIVTVTTNDGGFIDNVTVDVTASTGPQNVAEGADVTASAWQDDQYGYQPPELLVDGDTTDSTRWSASGFPQWAEIDLGGQYNLSEFRLYPYQDRAYQYTIEVSADGVTYTTVVDRGANTEAASVLTDTTSAVGRYVRLTVTGADGYAGTWVSINELEVDGVPYGAQSNIALGQPITASAWQDDQYSYQPPEFLVDGDTTDSTRWSADVFPQWAEIDLGGQYNLSEFRLYPYQDRAYQYTIEVSADGVIYTTIVDRSTNTEAASVLTDTASASGRYVRLTVTGADGYAGTWVSINELEVSGTPGSAPSTTTEDFESLSTGDQGSPTLTLGDYVYEDFRSDGSGTQNFRIIDDGGNNVLRSANWSRGVRITRTDGGTFDLVEFDMATAEAWGPADATVTAYVNGSPVASNSISDGTQLLTTFVFNWNDVDEVTIDFRGGSNDRFGYLDNVVLGQ